MLKADLVLSCKRFKEALGGLGACLPHFPGIRRRSDGFEIGMPR